MGKVKFSELLRFNPFDNKFRYDLDEKFFFEKIFVEFPIEKWEEVIYNIKSAVDFDSEGYKNFIFFYGPSGSGKTTFLHDFYRKNKNSYNFVFLNLIKNPGSAFDSELLKETIADNLREELIFQDNEFLTSLKLLYQNSLQNSSTSHQWRDFVSTFSDKGAVSAFENFLIQTEVNTSNVTAEDLFRVLSEKDLIFLYLYYKAYKMYTNNDNRPCIFIFDNLDELSQIYIARDLHKIIFNLFSRLQKVCKGILNFSIQEQIRFMLIFREVHYVILSPQLQERMNSLSTAIEFPKHSLTDMIIQKRTNVANEMELSITENEHRIRLLEFTDILSNVENEYTRKTISPLFNFDNRMLMNAIIAISEPNYKRIAFLNISKNVYQAIKEISNVGARGIIIISILKYLYKHATSFKDIVDDDRNMQKLETHRSSEIHCNSIRMALTLLCSLGEISPFITNSIIMDDEESYDQQSKLIRLHDALLKFENYDMYDNKIITNIFHRLFRVNDNSFELLVMLHHLDAIKDDKIDIENAIKEIIAWIGNKEDSRLHKSSVLNLNRTEIKINAPSAIYISKIFIHYEYFNLLANLDEGIYEVQPLFQCLGVKNERFEFEIQLESILQYLKRFFENIDIFFCDNICKKKIENDCNKPNCINAINKFRDNGFCFSNSLYSSRVITNHINYIDSFREYLWKIDVVSTSAQQPKLTDKNQIQSYLLGIIGEYIQLYETRNVNDHTVQNIMKEIKEEYNKALTANEMKDWRPIILKKNNNENGHR